MAIQVFTTDEDWDRHLRSEGVQRILDDLHEDLRGRLFWFNPRPSFDRDTSGPKRSRD